MPMPFPIAGPGGAAVPNLPTDYSDLVACWNFGHTDSFDPDTSAVAVNNLIASPADAAAQSDYNLERGDGSTSTTYPSNNGNGLVFDGGDYLGLAGSNTALLRDLHKDAATWSWLARVWLPTYSSGNNPILATVATGADHGVLALFQVNGTGKFYLGVYNGNNATSAGFSSDSALTTGIWTTIGMSVEINGTSFFYQDGYLQVGSSDTFTATVSASATAASYDLKIGAYGNAGTKAQSGLIVAAMVLSDEALSKSRMDAIAADFVDNDRFMTNAALP